MSWEIDSKSGIEATYIGLIKKSGTRVLSSLSIWNISSQPVEKPHQRHHHLTVETAWTNICRLYSMRNWDAAAIDPYLPGP